MTEASITSIIVIDINLHLLQIQWKPYRMGQHLRKTLLQFA